MKFINSRFELKYLLTHKQYYNFKAALLLYTKKDKFTFNSPNGKYFVKSLYYDNHNFLCFNNKLEGEQSRVKVRIRCYEKNKNDNKFVSIELKRRFGDLIKKDSSRVSLNDYEFYLNNGYWKYYNSVINEFIRINAKYCFSPITTIEYFREVYEDKTSPNVRICFDHNMKSSQSSDLFSRKLNTYEIDKEKIVLEVKTVNTIPLWLLKLIKFYSLNRISNSKYVQSILNLNLVNKGNMIRFSNANIN